ncbi:MAG: NADH-quinone oxidoreductase subunit NuoE [bacterium]
MTITFSKQAKERFEKIIRQYPEKRAAMLPVLYLAEQEFGHISSDVEKYVAELVEVPPVKVHEVMTFYTLIAREPHGRYHFQVCRGLSCDLLGCQKIREYLEKKLKIRAGETSKNRNYTLSEVECLGACETAPMMQLNEDYHGKLTPFAIDKILKELK